MLRGNRILCRIYTCMRVRCANDACGRSKVNDMEDIENVYYLSGFIGTSLSTNILPRGQSNAGIFINQKTSILKMLLSGLIMRHINFFSSSSSSSCFFFLPFRGIQCF